uniref:Replication protein A 70 kDa DNA-binding subunit B/D first OB fold domain-containing protein n=1 Tax=Tanacetum cinerariifolium TaxID=118510 RepID=A0A6L2P260_TANCI|nr:hypothetical protein [Tanacetum cinerariifolium]
MTQECNFDLKPRARNKVLEAKVYRKWINRKPPNPTRTDYCCILVDREGNAIQANMGSHEIPCFSSLLQEGAAYRISNFITTFNFVSYNQLHSKIHIKDNEGYEKQPTLAELALWDDMARNFNVNEYRSMEQPVIIAVSSCRVSTYGGGLQLSACPTTHYYLNQIFQTLKNSGTIIHQAVRFTCEGTVLAINTARDWYYASCSKCIKKVIDVSDMPTCVDHGPPPNYTYKYKFKAAISDGTAIDQFTSVNPKRRHLDRH